MKLTLPVVTRAARALAPAAKARSYILSPNSGLMRTMVSPTDIFRRQQALIDRAFDSTWDTSFVNSPCYEITNSDDKVQISLDLPGVKADDINVTFNDDRLSITGHREFSSDNASYESKFSQSFYIDPTIDAEKFTASIKDGVLTLSAPKDLSKLEEKVRQIPVLQEADQEAGIETGDAPSLETEEAPPHVEVKHEQAKEEEAVAA